LTVREDLGQSSAESSLHGVTLARYAAVRAALAEPFVVRRVLAVEGLAVADWRAADVAWKKRLMRDPERLFAQYRIELAAAEDWQLRIVSPLHQDVEAWADFLGAFRLHPEKVLAAAGMGMNDVSRLTRFWAEQAKLDGSLADRAAERMKRGFVELPRIVAEPRQLRRSRGHQAAAGAPVPGASVPGRPPHVRPQPRAGDQGARPTATSEPPPISIETPSYARNPAIAVTPAAPLLPSFLAAQAHAVSPAWNIASPAQDLPSPPHDENATQQLHAFVSGSALPFGPPSQRAPSSQRTAPAAPDDVNSTRELRAFPDSPVLPFGPPSQRVPSGPVSQRTVAAPVSQRVPSGPVSQRTVAAPVSQRVPSGPVSQRTVAAPVSQPAPGVGAPEMPLVQYAALCVDLGDDAELDAAILTRYRLSPESKAALDARYRARFTREPRLFDSFRRACDAHRAWLAEAAAGRTRR